MARSLFWAQEKRVRFPYVPSDVYDIIISADFFLLAGASSSLVRRVEWVDSTWELQGLWSNGKTPCLDHGNKGSTPFNPLGKLHSFILRLLAAPRRATHSPLYGPLVTTIRVRSV